MLSPLRSLEQLEKGDDQKMCLQIKDSKDA